MGLDLTVGSAALKEDYLGPLREQLNTAKVLLAEIEKNEEDVEGKYAVIPVTQGFPDGVGARAEKGDLPAAGTPSYDDLRVQMAYNYGRIEITGPSIKAMKSDRGSFIRAIDSQTKGMLNQLKKDYNRQLFGDGTGTLAKCGATSNSTTVVLADETDSMKFMRVGMDIDIIDVDDDSSVATNRKVTAIDRAKKTITISGASVTTDSTHRICRTGSWKKEINGLTSMIATTGTYQNIDRATAGNEYWHGNVFDAGGALRAISDDLLQQVQ
ncbi:MAG: phage major capsid protein, partial [Actinomycetota bacterium]|nr:phage major capsid protein [Actinomycetota bacterium]